LVTEYFRLTPETWGQDAYNGAYDWLAAKKTSSA
jgi:hypothetical protein